MLSLLKALLAVVPFLRDLLEWWREMQHARELARSEEQHTANRHRIDEAFADTLRSPASSAGQRLPDSAAPGGQPGGAPAEPPAVPRGPHERP